MNNKQLQIFDKLRYYCETEQFKGWDPYDGLNSEIFRYLPFLKKSALIRLIAIQGFKRFPFNIRSLLLVPKNYNTKGLALLLKGYCNLYKCTINNKTQEVGDSQVELLEKIELLSQLLLKLSSKGYSGACWGYSFDWQSKAFFLPKDTPTVVATSFVTDSLLSSYEITKNQEYLDKALSAADFILKDLNRIPKKQGFMFSYSPLDNQAVYNATLLGSKTLALLYSYTNKDEFKNLAFESVQAVCDLQNPDGSFPHSDQIGNSWRDNFHTGFKLESLACYRQHCKDSTFTINIEKGYQYWIQNFFDSETGFARYYDKKNSNLIDLHCTAQAFPTLYKLNKMKEQEKLADKILNWAIDNMFDFHKGFFYFQKQGNHINKTPYMRWPNAWMFYGISYWILYQKYEYETL